jgi:hypothetical protein
MLAGAKISISMLSVVNIMRNGTDCRGIRLACSRYQPGTISVFPLLNIMREGTDFRVSLDVSQRQPGTISMYPLLNITISILAGANIIISMFRDPNIIISMFRDPNIICHGADCRGMRLACSRHRPGSTSMLAIQVVWRQPTMEDFAKLSCITS